MVAGPPSSIREGISLFRSMEYLVHMSRHVLDQPDDWSQSQSRGTFCRYGLPIWDSFFFCSPRTAVHKLVVLLRDVP